MSTKEKKGLTEIENFQLGEVSIVDWGANNKKRFPIFKGKGQSMNEEILKAVLETELDEEKELQVYFEKAKISEKGIAAARAAMRILGGFKDEIPEELFNQLASLAGYPSPKEMAKADPQKKEDEMACTTKVKKSIDGLSDESQAQFEAIMKARDAEIENLKKANEEIQKSLSAERDARELEEWMTKAKTELSHFPGKSTEEIAKSLKALNAVDPELAKSQFESMKAASDALKSSEILKAKGSGHSAGETDAWSKIEKAASDMQKALPTLTKEAAIEKVLKERPELYSEYEQQCGRQ